MTALFCGFIALFGLRLVRRHGWEYVPLLLLAVEGWVYLGSHGRSALADPAVLTAVAGIHLVTRKQIRDEIAMSASW